MPPKSPQRNNPFANTGLYNNGEHKPHRQETIKPPKLTVANGQGAWSSRGTRARHSEGCSPSLVLAGCSWMLAPVPSPPLAVFSAVFHQSQTQEEVNH